MDNEKINRLKTLKTPTEEGFILNLFLIRHY